MEEGFTFIEILLYPGKKERNENHSTILQYPFLFAPTRSIRFNFFRLERARVTVGRDFPVFSTYSLKVIFGFCFMNVKTSSSTSFIVSFMVSFIVSFVMSFFLERRPSSIVSSINSTKGVDVPLFPEIRNASPNLGSVASHSLRSCSLPHPKKKEVSSLLTRYHSAHALPHPSAPEMHAAAYLHQPSE